MRCSVQAERRLCPVKISRDVEKQSPFGKIIYTINLRGCPLMTNGTFLSTERAFNNPGLEVLQGLYPDMEGANRESLRDLSYAKGLCQTLKDMFDRGVIDFTLREEKHFDPIASNGSLHY